MSRPRVASELPPCYALVMPGLEPVAEEEIRQDLRGDVKKTEPGLVVFRLPHIDEAVLGLRTVEDVFLFAWGTDKLTYRAVDLESIERWTRREADWDQLLRIHHAIRPKPKGKPTFRLVTQMTGTHGYRRVDAGNALGRGLAGKLPASWRHAEENAAVEIWLTITGATAVCGLRLSDKTMRHRTYKLEHLSASLRPTVAGAMVRLAEARSGMVVLDPMCGAGTILAEQLQAAREAGLGRIEVLGGDRDRAALKAAAINLRRLGTTQLALWDGSRLPLADASVDRIISNLPFGKRIGRPEEIGPLLARVVPQFDRVLRPGARAVLLAGEFGLLRAAVKKAGWKLLRELRVRVLGQLASLSVWRKPGEYSTISVNQQHPVEARR
jgi:23S rRNA G2445 N2-methylase RlmL